MMLYGVFEMVYGVFEMRHCRRVGLLMQAGNTNDPQVSTVASNNPASIYHI